MILFIDNYDSFVFNLVRYVRELGFKTTVKRNDEISVQEAEQMNPKHIILSPGPCSPNEAGICNDLIKKISGKIPILGVCLGHQCIGHVFGARVEKSINPMHGKSSLIEHHNHPIFEDISNPMVIGRYHSLIVKDPLPDCLEVLARCDKGEIMAIKHSLHPTIGVQFHPESILTPQGKQLIYNFLTYY